MSAGTARRGAALALAAALTGLASTAPAAWSERATPSPSGSAPYRLGVRLGRGVAKLGEPVTYRGWITGGDPARVRFLAPDSGGVFTWGPVRVAVRSPRGRSAAPDRAGGVSFADFDTVFVEARLQAFLPGEQVVPGLAFELDDGSGPLAGRLPMTRLVVSPVVSAADTSARLRGLRGPLAAPWWERVPWRIVLALAAALLVLATTVMALARRRPAPVAPAPVVTRDPATQALAELEALRRLGLAGRGRFAEHAFQLGRIVRRFLEATLGTPLPGDTTPEFVGHLEVAQLTAEDLERIGTLMRSWDRVKFARAEASADEAARAEQSVEGLVRRLARRTALPPAGLPEKVA